MDIDDVCGQKSYIMILLMKRVTRPLHIDGRELKEYNTSKEK
jgi:hypothetical protein